MDNIVVRGGMQILGPAADGTSDPYLTKDATTGEVGTVPPVTVVNGADGKTVLSGAAAPTTEGVDGDFYIRTSTWMIYGPKAAGVWPAGVSLIGPSGAAGAAGATGPSGNTIRTGSGAPSNALGVDGDYYIDTAVWNIYGPKTAGIWPSAVSLIGPTGSAGATGATGSNGSNGVNAYMYTAYADDSSGTGYILVSSNDGTASLTAFNANKKYIAHHLSTTQIGASISASTFSGKWARYLGDGDRWTTTSSTSATIATGTVNLVVGTDLSYSTGQRVVIALNDDPTNMMEGYVITYNPTTGQISVDVDTITGSGTYNVWDVSLQTSLPDAIEFAFANVDVDIGTEVADSFSEALATRVSWEYVISKGAAARGGIVEAVRNGAVISYTEVSSIDIGTIDVELTVDINAGLIRLLATASTDNWTVKGLRRIISS